jgi:pentatricopeptide repeat protein
MGNSSAAIMLLKEIDRIGVCQTDIGIYSMIIDGLCEESKVKEGLQMFGVMMRKGIMPNVVTYSCLI